MNHTLKRISLYGEGDDDDLHHQLDAYNLAEEFFK